MNTRHFDYIGTITETGSLSEAARQLHVTQPVLSRYLSHLEQELGVQLFIRERGRFHITSAGQIYLNGTKRMKELQTQMLRSFDVISGIKELELHIGLSPYRGGQELASFYPSLLGRYPTLNLKVTEGTSRHLSEQLNRNQLSAIINLYDPGLMPHMKIATLIKAEILIALPDYHPLTSQAPSSLASPGYLTISQLCGLTDIPFVYLDADTILGQLVDNVCQRYAFSPMVLLRTCNSIAVSSLLSSGTYAGFVLENTAEKLEHMRFFHFPHPVFLYSGMIFTEDHQVTEMEQYLYQLEYQQAQRTTPRILYQNELGKRLWNGGE